MRDIDRKEIFGNLNTDNPLELGVMIHGTLNKQGDAWIGWFNGRPVAAMGIFEQWQGCWQAWSLGTDRYYAAVIHFRERFETAYDNAKIKGLRRLEAKSIVGHTQAHHLMRKWGFEQEGILRKYGKDGDDYIQFARVD